MSKRYNDGSHYENHPKAAELHNLGEHAHLTGEQHGKGEHLSGHEHSRQGLEHAPHHDGHSGQHHSFGQPAAFGHSDIAELAYSLWQERGYPVGSPEEDWFRAAHHLRARAEHNQR